MKQLDEDEFVKEIFALAHTEEVQEMAKEAVERYKGKYNVFELKESDIFKILNASYVANRFFGKSRYWISQKLNHNVKNGKESKFSDEEYKKLKAAIETIAMELQDLADSM